MRFVKSLMLTAALLAVPAVSHAQTSQVQYQNDLSTARSVVQKAGLGTLYASAALGAFLAVNAPPMGEQQCAACGELNKGAYDALTITHFAFAATTLGLYITSEILAEKMSPNPYYVGDPQRQEALQAMRWVNVGFFAAQPLLGVLAAHPWLIGVPPEHRVMFSRVMRTLHLAVGAGTATSYTAVAVMQW